MTGILDGQMEDLPRITIAYDVPEPVRSRARWAIEQLLSTAAVRYREVAPGHGPDVGYGCPGSRLTLGYEAEAWNFTRVNPLNGLTARDDSFAGIDLPAATFWFLARVEELIAERDGDESAFDEHDRFRAEASAVAIDDAEVDGIARHVRETLGLLPISLSAAAPWVLALTHDIDVPRRFTRAGIRRTVRTAVKGDAGRLASLLALLTLPFNLLRRRDPWTNADRIADLERRADARSTSYLLLGRRTPQDGEQATRAALDRYARDAHEGGGQIALHGSYTVTDEPDELGHELDAWRGLADAVGADDDVVDHRFHYLRHRPTRDWVLLDALGIRSDASLGHASRPGLRAGFSHPYRAWDHAADRSLDLVILPLVFMDATLQPRYLDMSPRDARSMLTTMLDWFADDHSAVSVLWHNDQLCAGPGSGRTTRLYRWLLHEARRRGGECTDVGSVVESYLAHVEAQRSGV